MEAGDNPKDISAIYDYHDSTFYTGEVDYSDWLHKPIILPPTALRGSAYNGSAYLTWTPAFAAVGYKVYYGEESGVYTQTLMSRSIGSEEFVLDGLTNGAAYYVTVTSADIDGDESDYSAEIELTVEDLAGTVGTLAFDQAYYNPATDTAIISLTDADVNQDPDAVEQVSVSVTSDADSRGISVTLTETGLDTGVFTTAASGLDVGFASVVSDQTGALIRAFDGNTVTANYDDISPRRTRSASAIADASPPVTAFAPSGEFHLDGEDQYAPATFTYSLDATDAYSGVAATEYSLNGTGFVEFSEPFAIGWPGTHTVEFRSVDAVGNWETTNTETVIVETTPPEAPDGLAGTVANFEVHLSWNPNSETDLAGYNVYRDGVQVNTTLVTSTEFTDIVADAKTYTYNITAVDWVGTESQFSLSLPVTVDISAPVISVPTSGSVFTDKTIAVRGSCQPTATAFIYVNGECRATALASSTGQFSASAVEVDDGQSSITAISVNSYGVVSPESDAVNVFVDARPEPPVGLVTAPGDTVITLSWDANTETDLSGYHVYRDGKQINNELLTGTSYTDAFLTNGKSYGYTVTAVDVHGSESQESDEVEEAPVAGAEWAVGE